MKNDFREFYDEKYIMHNITEEDHLQHGEWGSNLRKYIDKIRTRSGKWRYIYPEDLKKKANNLKRDVSYAARNLKSKITGKNKTFNKKVVTNDEGIGHWEGVTRELKPDGRKLKVKKNKYGAWEVPSGGVTFINTKKDIHNAYAKENKKAGKGMAKYNERHQIELEKAKQHKKVEKFNTNIKRAREEVRNRQDTIKSKGLKSSPYSVRTTGLGYKRKRKSKNRSR